MRVCAPAGTRPGHPPEGLPRPDGRRSGAAPTSWRNPGRWPGVAAGSARRARPGPLPQVGNGGVELERNVGRLAIAAIRTQAQDPLEGGILDQVEGAVLGAPGRGEPRAGPPAPIALGDSWRSMSWMTGKAASRARPSDPVPGGDVVPGGVFGPGARPSRPRRPPAQVEVLRMAQAADEHTGRMAPPSRSAEGPRPGRGRPTAWPVAAGPAGHRPGPPPPQGTAERPV